MRVRIILVAIVVGSFLFIISASILAQVLYTTTFSTYGNVITAGVGVYWDDECTNPVDSINWASVEPGGVKDRACYIRNEGNSAKVLSFETSNWNPSSAQNYMTLSWNYGGQFINPNDVVKVRFTLSVSNSITGITRYSFDITVIGSG